MYGAIFNFQILIVSMLCMTFTSCKKTVTTEDKMFFAKGADISWVSEMEDSARRFYDHEGNEKDIFQILKDLGMNTVRFRVWVNPSTEYNTTEDVVAKCVRAKKAGFRIMIDLHYSDTWADPGKQFIPAAWQGMDFDEMKSAMVDYTGKVMLQLKNAGISPDWVQVGNEVNDGMLWPVGKASVSMDHFAQFINAGYESVKSVFPEAKVIVHVSNGFDNNLFRWVFDGLTGQRAKFDVIGMSLYPTVSNWERLNEQCLENMKDMIARYGKQVMIVECGMPWDQPEISNMFLTDLISKVKSVGNNEGLGVLYWEPEAYDNWKRYTLGAFDNTGKPTKAMDAFR